MLADDENLGKYCGSTTAGLGKPEDRHTARERSLLLEYGTEFANNVPRTGEDVEEIHS